MTYDYRASSSCGTCIIEVPTTTAQNTITTGSNPMAGELAKILFSKTYGQAPHIVLSPANSADISAVQPYVDSTSSDFIINFINADTAQQTFKFNYFNVQ